MSNFSWKIQHVDLPLRSMVVEYTKNGISKSLNIPIPQRNDEIITTINQYAPTAIWDQPLQVASVMSGMTGIGISFTEKPTLDQLKDKAKGKINKIRELIINSGVVYKDVRFDSNEQTISRLSAIISSAQNGIPLPENFAWRSTNNEMIPMALPDLVELLNVMTQNVSNTFLMSWEKKQQIDKAQTEDEIASVKWESDALNVIL